MSAQQAKAGDRAVVIGASRHWLKLIGREVEVVSDPYQVFMSQKEPPYRIDGINYPGATGYVESCFVNDVRCGSDYWQNRTVRLLPLRDPDADKADTRKADRKQPERIA